MEFYPSFEELLGKSTSPVTLIFGPIFLATTLLEGLLIYAEVGYTHGKMQVCLSAWPLVTSLHRLHHTV